MIDDFRPTEPAGQTRPQNTNMFASNIPSYGAPMFPTPANYPQQAPEPLTPLEQPQKKRHKLREWYASLGKKQKALVILAILLVLGLIAGGAVYALRPSKQPVVATVKKTPAAAPVSTTVPSLLTGLQVDPAVNSRQVTGVMIENSPEARPQSGLDKAGVVFEAIAEGGITRFLALYQDSTSDFIGPVRSARPYYIQWCQGFDCAYAHVGGSPEALQDIKDWNIKNLDQFVGAGYFQRVGNRAAPHNVYSSSAKLGDYENSRGYTASTYTGLDHANKEVAAPAASQNAKAINLNYPGSAYDVHYDYDAATNSYKRSEGGAPHNVVDAASTTTQLSPKVVIAIAVPRALQSDNKHNTYAVVGSGEAVVFQGGAATHGTWTKASPTSQLSFLDDKGTTIKLNPGQTWISALDAMGDATFN